LDKNALDQEDARAEGATKLKSDGHVRIKPIWSAPILSSSSILVLQRRKARQRSKAAHF
jgi:hypothetical protein